MTVDALRRLIAWSRYAGEEIEKADAVFDFSKRLMLIPSLGIRWKISSSLSDLEIGIAGVVMEPLGWEVSYDSAELMDDGRVQVLGLSLKRKPAGQDTGTK